MQRKIHREIRRLNGKEGNKRERDWGRERLTKRGGEHIGQNQRWGEGERKVVNW